MHGFELILGHLIGDYIMQNDWMATWKSAAAGAMTLDDPQKFGQWKSPWYKWRPSVACLVHCCFYTLAIAMTCWSWLPLWAYGVVFALHYPVDRFRLARFWMDRVSGQKSFASGPLSPWSIIIVDNIAHLIVLYAVAKASIG